MGDSFEYLETVTTFATEGFAFVEHKSVGASLGRGMYKVARVTSATCSRRAVQMLANTFIRMADNCTFEYQAVEAMAEFAQLVRERANFSQAKVDRAWRGLAGNARHAQLAARQQTRWERLMTDATIN